MTPRVPAKSRYAVDAMLALAASHSGKPMKVTEIARRKAIPARYLELILKSLRQAGLVDSRRGSEGGYWLVAEPETLTVAALLRAMEGPLAPPAPASRREAPDAGPGTEPGWAEPEPFEALWSRALAAFWEVLEATTVADLLREHDEQRRRHAPTWVI